MIFAAFIVVGFFTLICFGACLATRREMPPMQNSIRAWRNPGETDSDMIDRLLSASPTHQAQLKEADFRRAHQRLLNNFDLE